MKSIIALVLLIGSVYSVPTGHIVGSAIVGHKTVVGHAPAVAVAHQPVAQTFHTVHQAPPVAVHHPAKYGVAEQSYDVVSQGPKHSGYAFSSEVRHDTVAHAAPIVHAAPVHHAAPIVHAAPIAHAAPVVHAAPIAHAAPVVAHAGYAHAPIAPHTVAGPAKIISHPAVAKSYSVETGAIHTQAVQHYAPAHIEQVHAVKTHVPVAVAAPVVHKTVVHAAPIHHAAPLYHHGAPLVNHY